MIKKFLLIIGLMLLATNCWGATILEDNFNSYNNGDLNGQGSAPAWSGSVQYDVQDSVVKEGAKAVIANSGGDYSITRTGTAQTDGKMTVYVRTVSHASFGSTQYFCFGPYTVSPILALWRVFFHQDGYIKMFVDSSMVNIQTYNDNQWYQVEVEWRSSPDYKYRVSIDDGTWTDWEYGYLTNAWSTGLNVMFFDAWMVGGSVYFDYIAEEPIAAGVIKTYNGVAWSSVKTINGVAVASVKTINGAAAQ